MFLAKLLGSVRRGIIPDLAEGEPGQVLALNSRGEALVSQVLPSRAELVRLGNSWSVSIPTGSAFAPVAAWPTTLENIELYNNEPAGGKSYIIDSVWAAAITSIAAASSFALLVQHLGPLAAPTNNTALLIVSRSGRRSYPGNAFRAVAGTRATASQWDVVAGMAASPSASIGASVYADLFGYYVVPPGNGIAFNLVASTAAGTAIQGVGWHEVQLPTVSF